MPYPVAASRGKVVGNIGDSVAPVCTIGSSDSDPTIVSPITITFTWSEPVTGFTSGDVTIGNGTGVTFSTVDSSHYTYTVVPNAGATVTIDVNASVCQDAAGNNNTAATQYSVASKVLLFDNFTDTRAAGAVNGTAPTPGPGGNRVVTDTNSKLSIGSDVAVWATGGVGAGDPALWYSSFSRGAGAMVMSKVSPGATCRLAPGVDTAQAGGPSEGINFFASAEMYDVGSGAKLGISWASGTAYTLASVLRSTGSYCFIKTASGSWKLIFASGVGSTATLYPTINIVSSATTIASVDFMRTWKTGTYLPTPLAYDAFTRANGALGNSMTTGPDGQAVTARAWTDTAGTWGVASNVANCSALSGGIGLATIPATNDDVIATVNLTRSAGAAGLLLRYQDADNYLYAYHDGTNIALVKREAGVESNVIAPTAATYASSGTIQVILEGTTAYLYYRDVYRGTGTVPASTNAVHGLWTNNTQPTLDAFTVLPRGTDGEYSALDTYAANF